MKLIECVKQKIEELALKWNNDELELDKLVTILFEEAGLDKKEFESLGYYQTFYSTFFDFLIELFYEYVINNKLKVPKSYFLISKIPLRAKVYYGEVKSDEEFYVNKGIVFHKDLFFKILESLNLDKTKKYYLNYVLSKNEEIATSILTKDEIKEYSKSENIYRSLSEELSE